MTRSKETYHGSSLAAGLDGARQVVRADDHGVAELAPHVLLSEISFHKKTIQQQQLQSCSKSRTPCAILLSFDLTCRHKILNLENKK